MYWHLSILDGKLRRLRIILTASKLDSIDRFVPAMMFYIYVLETSQ